MSSSFLRYFSCLLYLVSFFSSSLFAQSSIGVAPVPQSPLGQLNAQGHPAISWQPVAGHGDQSGLITAATFDASEYDIETGDDQLNWNYGDPQEYRESYADRNTFHYSSYGVDMIFSNESSGPDEYGSVFCLVEFAHTPFPFWPGPIGGTGDKAKFDQMHYFNASEGENIDMIDLSPLGVTHPDQVQWYPGTAGYPYSYLIIDDNDGDMDEVAAAVLIRSDRMYGTFSLAENIIYAEGQTNYSVYRRVVGQASYTLLVDGLTDASFVDLSLIQPQGVFEYVITATDMFGESVYSQSVVIGGASTFPVEWLSFEATWLDGQYVELEWATASETRNERFDIERSLDGRTFTQVGSVAGAGTSTTPTQYTYVDLAIPDQQIYYRIRQIDLDGQSSYSEVRSIQPGESAPLSLKIGPNPTSEVLYLNGYPRDRELGLTVMDMQGKAWLSTTLTRTSVFPYQLQVSSLPAGIYTLVVEDADEETRVSKRFIRQ